VKYGDTNLLTIELKNHLWIFKTIQIQNNH
jgi:hypothetical protein